jgi:signal peptidase I
MFEAYKQRRSLREFEKNLKRYLAINADLIGPERLDNIRQMKKQMSEARRDGKLDEAESLRNRIEQQLEAALPPVRGPKALREWVEVLLVATLVAWGGIRTFFVQPFKIPTGSMQPTLYGIHSQPEFGVPSLFVRLGDQILFGKKYTGTDAIFSGDRIFVDKFSYHFRKPRRGEIIVFGTASVEGLPPEMRGKFYIKRLIGLPGDEIQIRPPYVYINGEILDERPAFRRIYSRKNGYAGYVPGEIPAKDAVFKVPDGHLYALGDNSLSSLDSRYWGAFHQNELIGRAFFVYWPFGRRFGRVE